MTGAWRGGGVRVRPAFVAGLLVVVASLAALGCGSGGPGLRGGTERIAVARTIGGIGSIEVTSEAAVRDSVFRASPRAVWSVLPEVFRTLGVETTTVDAPSGLIGNERFEGPRIEDRRLSLYLDCGSTFGGARADVYRVSLFLAVQIAVAEEGGTLVTIVVDASARPREVSGNPVHCGSRGTLERRVMELLGERLGAGPVSRP